jgi:hypothetical protein
MEVLTKGLHFCHHVYNNNDVVKSEGVGRRPGLDTRAISLSLNSGPFSA